MHVVTYWELETLIEDVNQSLFFSQLKDIDVTIISSKTDYVVSRNEDGTVYLNVSKKFENDKQFTYQVIYELIKIYEEQTTGKKCEFGSVFDVYMSHAWKKFGEDMEEPTIEI